MHCLHNICTAALYSLMFNIEYIPGTHMQCLNNICTAVLYSLMFNIEYTPGTPLCIVYI